MNFEGGGNALQQHQQLQQQQEHQQNQLWEQLGQINSNNLMQSAFMGRTGHLPMLSGQSAAVAAQFNLQSQLLTLPRKKAGLIRGLSPILAILNGSLCRECRHWE